MTGFCHKSRVPQPFEETINQHHSDNPHLITPQVLLSQQHAEEEEHHDVA
jgi:hypothetical protein